MAKKTTRKKKRRRDDGPRRSTGLMRGMRRGFKNVAAGTVEGKGRYRWVGTAVTVVLIILALVLLSKRF